MNVFELEGSISLDSSAYEKAVKDAMKDGENLGKSLQENAKQFQEMQAQIDSLSKELADSKAEVSRMQAELDKVTKSAAGMGKETSKTSTEISEMSDKMKVLETRINATTAEYKEAQERVNELQKKLLESAAATGETSDETKQFAKELEKAERQAKTLEKKLDGLNAEYENERSAADKAGKETDEYGDSAEEAAGDTKKLDKEADKLGGTFDGLGEKIGKVAGAIKTGLVTAAKIGVGAVAAAGAAVSGIVMKSVSGFGEYEQLKGGAQKIFEGIDFEKIQKDADNAFKELNMNAAEYLGSINLAGASFTQTMGSEKAYETARKGMLAISDFASGTGKNIDELNQKYQMITRSTASYQSIADQFSGILPQTNDAFLEQAQAAGLLSEEYQKLTEVPVDEYQQAVTEMLVKGVEAQNLSNNTLRESGETLTGSIATAKKAWEDLIVAFSDPDADLDAKISNFVDSGKAALENITPTIVNAMTGIGKAVKDLAPVIGNEIPKLIQELVPPLIQATTGLISSLVSSFPDALKALTDKSTVNTVLIAVQDMLSAVMDGLSGIIELAPDIIPDLLNQIGNAMLNSINMLEGPLENIIYDLSRLIQKSLPVLIPIVLELFKTILSSVATLSSALLPELADIFVTLFEVLKEQDMADVVLTIVNALSTIFEAVAESGEIIADNLLPIVTTLTEMLLKGFEEHSEEMQPALTSLLVNLLKAVFFVLIDTAGILIAGALTPLVNAVIALWEGVFQPLDDKLSDGLLSFEEWLNGIKDKAAEFVAEIIGKVVGFFTDIGEKIFNFKQDVSEKIGEIIGSITSKFTGLLDNAKNWGKDLIDNFLGGITDKLPNVSGAMSTVADKIGEYIHFSEPDKGALADFHTFAPDMMKLFAQGIADNANLVYSEIDDLTRGISNDLAVKTAPVAPTVATNGTVNNFSVNVSFDGATISENTDLDNLSDTLIEKISEGLAMLDVFQTRAYGGATI